MMCKTWVYGGAVAAAMWCGVALAQAPADQPLPPNPVGEDLVRALMEANIPPLPRDAVKLPAELPVGTSAWINSQRDSRAARMTVYSAAHRAKYGPLTAAPGRALVVLDVELVNIIPYTLIQQQQVPTEYRIPNVADHLYLVINQQYAARLHADAKDLPGHLVVRDLKLERVGSSLRANVVFDIPAVTLETVELRFYDFGHGHIVMPLVWPATEVPKPQPPKNAAGNEVVNAGIFKVEKFPKLGETVAPEGMQFVAVDFRATSRFMMESDATAFDPKTRPGQKMQVGTVADWTDSRKFLQLVVDGERGYTPQPQTTLLEQPRFLPDVMTGGTIVFLAPADAKALELRCDFPNAKTPGGKVLRPQGLTLPLEGAKPQLARIDKPMAKTEDSVFVVNVLKQTTPDTFAGKKPADGKKWIVLDVTVSTKTKQGEHFQTLEQLKIVDAAGTQSAVDPASLEGVYRPTELVWIPQGERRAFQVAYQFPASELQPRLAYMGVDKAEIVNLMRLAPGAEAPKAETLKAETPAKVDQPPKVDEQPKVVEPAKPPVPPSAAEAPIDVNGQKFPARVPVKPNLKPKGIAGVGVTPEQVNASIDKGAAFLWKTLERDADRRYFLGDLREHTIVALALVHCDYHKKNPQFDAALRKWLGKFQPNKNGSTYQVGIVAMIIESYGDPTFFDQLKACTKWLVETQGTDGSWGYGRAIDNKYFATDNADTRVLKVEGGRPVEAIETITREGEYKVEFEGDTSVTQYAILGLNSAERSGIKIPADVWKRALNAHRERQVPADGGWGYTGPSSPYGSMTAAGVCGVALTRYALQQPSNDGMVERGLGWLNAHFSVKEHPKSDEWLYYYLYSLERVGRILDTEFIGEHEWYPLGVKFLLGSQTSEGSWTDKRRPNEDEVHTSFALLFLTRATPSLIAEKRNGPGTLKTAVMVPPGKKLYIILDASGSMLEEMNGKVKFEIAREALTQLIKELPANAEVGLRAYGYRKRAIEAGASEDTNLLVPVEKLQRQKLLDIMAGIRARGKTPMALSLEQAKGDIPAGTEESPVTVLLLTDGGEDSQPRKDPIAAAKLFANLPHTKVRIVGFDINREDWSQQLQAMATAAGGQYLPAAQGDTLLRELRTAVYETPDEFTLFDEAGKSLGTGKFGDSMQVPAGKYRIRATYAGRSFEEPVHVNAGLTTAVTFQSANVAKNPGAPVEPPKPAEAAKPAETPAAPAKAKFCTSCGAKLEGAGKFCTSCGAKLAQ